MSLTERELWTVIHGMCLGALFLLSFSGGLAELWSMRGELVHAAGIDKCVRRLIVGTWVMAIVAWLTVISGTYVVYPWYRAAPPKQAAASQPMQSMEKVDLTQYPKAYLVANPKTAAWHSFGMEWKEHVAWLAPLLATVVAFAVVRFGKQLSENRTARYTVISLFFLSFAIAGIAGVLGALITKAAPLT